MSKYKFVAAALDEKPTEITIRAVRNSEDDKLVFVDSATGYCLFALTDDGTLILYRGVGCAHIQTGPEGKIYLDSAS